MTAPSVPFPPVLRVATMGSVDDGKSTLVGRLLQDSHALLADQLGALRAPGAGLAAAVDGLRAEREQGITIDVAYRYFATARRKFVLADTPGHEQYTRNTATGASTADVAVVLVDAERGLSTQTRRHAAIAALFGVPHLVLAVSKMDKVGFAEPVFDEIVREFTELAVAVGLPSITPVPVAALTGHNVVRPSSRLRWYQGPSLLAHLESVRVPEPGGPGFRFPVQCVLRDGNGYRAAAGRVLAGAVRVGDRVTVLPAGVTAEIAGLDSFDGALAEAGRGQSIAIRLAGAVDVARGDLLAVDPPAARTRLPVTVCWFADRDLRAGARLLVRHGTRETAAEVARVGGRLDLAGPRRVPADRLRDNDLGSAELELAEPIVADPYRGGRGTGALLLLDPHTGATLGAAMVEATGPPPSPGAPDPEGER